MPKRRGAIRNWKAGGRFRWLDDMADLYANHFHDLGEAEQTTRDLRSTPHDTSQLSVALHRLADWQLTRATPGGRAAARK
jgi:hypothetical protein